jgi:HAD superfamily hydrolase (TIGR01509 family)
MERALLWDHDGVLVDTERLYFQATREVLASEGVALDEALYQQLFLVGGGGAWHLVHDRDAEYVAQLKQRRNHRYSALLASEDVMIPGALAMLEDLSKLYRMAIVTSSRRAHFDVIHQHTGLPRFFEFILAREDYVDSKPHPEPYLAAVARLGLPAEACLVIEDSERGLRAAVAAGLGCWVIPSALTRALDFSAAERRFESLATLHAALRAR